MKFILFLFLITFCACLNVAFGAYWSDEFNGGSLDTNKWEIVTGNGCGQPAGCGWGNSLEFFNYI